jgi:MFS superfamily sulfate permease-like transporter
MSRPSSSLVVDLSASMVVFLVALPLCLGLALGAGAPLLSGIVAGVVGGVLVGALSRSPLSVSGPAAGMTAIVAAGIADAGSWSAFAIAVVIAGALQVAAGVVRLGNLIDFIPNSVVRGVLAAIGVLLILKQAPHLIGYDPDYEGDFSFWQRGGDNTFSALEHAAEMFEPGAAVIGVGALLVLWLWERPWRQRVPVLGQLPGGLVAVLVAVACVQWLGGAVPWLQLGAEHLVQLPDVAGPSAVLAQLTLPDVHAVTSVAVWRAGATLALIASLETLVGVATVDKLDPEHRQTPPNRELLAQGLGNIVSGALGGLPVTSFVVRNSVNVAAGARSRWSAIGHGVLLLVSVLFLGRYLNHVPLCALAAVLIATGYKLTQPQVYREMQAAGRDQFLPFLVTIAGVLLTDLMVGIGIGIAAGVYFHVRSNFRNTMVLVSDGNNFLLRLRKDVSFFAKSQLRQRLAEVPAGARLLIDVAKVDSIDDDIIDLLREFTERATRMGIQVELRRDEARAAQRRIELAHVATATEVQA